LPPLFSVFYFHDLFPPPFAPSRCLKPLASLWDSGILFLAPFPFLRRAGCTLMSGCRPSFSCGRRSLFRTTVYFVAAAIRLGKRGPLCIFLPLVSRYSGRKPLSRSVGFCGAFKRLFCIFPPADGSDWGPLSQMGVTQNPPALPLVHLLPPPSFCTLS